MECNAPAARNSDAAWFMVEVGLVPTAPVRTAAPTAVGMPMWSASTAPESESPLSESLAQLDVDETETWAGPACGGTGMTCGCGCWWCICGACGYACGCATGACGYACGWCATGALLTAGAAGGMWRCAEGGAGCITAARTVRGACWTTGAVGSGERTSSGSGATRICESAPWTSRTRSGSPELTARRSWLVQYCSTAWSPRQPLQFGWLANESCFSRWRWYLVSQTRVEVRSLCTFAAGGTSSGLSASTHRPTRPAMSVVSCEGETAAFSLEPPLAAAGRPPTG
mmetsp:Transcript_87077/g.247074  ORF Transcript_87077/g.247074 Transcript_87077/m.247074 type:complete len:285 (-) Transcript_87077:191-1045(-)